MTVTVANLGNQNPIFVPVFGELEDRRAILTSSFVNRLRFNGNMGPPPILFRTFSKLSRYFIGDGGHRDRDPPRRRRHDEAVVTVTVASLQAGTVFRWLRRG